MKMVDCEFVCAMFVWFLVVDLFIMVDFLSLSGSGGRVSRGMEIRTQYTHCIQQKYRDTISTTHTFNADRVEARFS